MPEPQPTRDFAILAARALFLAVHLAPLAAIVCLSTEHSIRGKALAALLVFSTLPFYWLKRTGPMHVARGKLQQLWFGIGLILFVLAVWGVLPAFVASEELQALITAPVSHLFGLPGILPDTLADMRSRASLGLIAFEVCFYLQWFVLVPRLFAGPASATPPPMAGGSVPSIKRT